MGKYEPLRRFLESRKSATVAMTFAEVEKILSFKLPASHRYRAWWSNNGFNNVMTKEWLAAGFRTEQVDIDGRKLVFRRAQSTSERNERTLSAGEKQPYRHPGFGLMKGLTTIAPGTDLTAPTGGDWGKTE